MKITSHLFEAYNKCSTKCWLLSQGEAGLGNTYADWVHVQNDSYRSDGVSRLLDDFHHSECVIAPPSPINLKAAKWKITVDMLALAHSMESRIHALERVQFDDAGKTDQFIPICFVFTNKITQSDKLRLVFDALILSEIFGREIGLGKIIHGENHIVTKINISTLRDKAKSLVQGVADLLSNNSPPELILKRCCCECEFQQNCRNRALEKDDLSLLAIMTGNERKQHRSKGIFTVNQLSYTFSPRRTPKRAKNPTNKHYPALQALAIRENTVFIHGSPNFPESKTQIYLDIEGLPDHDSYYLIGAFIVTNRYEKMYSFWANNESEGTAIFAEFIETISTMTDYSVFHYGDYEKLALMKMKLRVPANLHQRIDNILDHSVNVLSLIYSHFYFPSYSNGLKDICSFLGYKWVNPGVSGLNSIIWRTCWNRSKDQEAKNNLTLYNEDDCKALKLLCDFIFRSKDPDKLTDDGYPKTSLTKQMLKTKSHWQLFAPRSFALEDMKHINKCAYFDYQREKVFVRTDPHIRALKRQNQRKVSKRKASTRPNKVVNIEITKCPSCQSRKIEKLKEMGHDVIDLNFSRGGIRKCITRFVSYRYECLKCHEQFRSEERPPRPVRYGHGLNSWCVYLNNVCGVNMSKIGKSLLDTFGLYIPDDAFFRARSRVRALYDPLCDEILQGILAEAVIHVDETTVRLRRQQKGYVWVLTSMNNVYYFYKPTRETSFLKDMLAQFSGTLISDFYTGYDSLPFSQQKCLVHLIRDIDDDVLRNPIDNELKVMAQEFGILLRSIVSTIDKFGLKRRYLQKHKRDVKMFLTQLSAATYSSEIVTKYKKRFEKSGQKMFTFLDYDGVPWNNNNAEHAIHRFAKHRRNADGMFTEETLAEYLVLATVFETCEFNNINVLQFLLSKINTLDGLLQMASRKLAR